MTRIIQDLEHGTVVLFHELAGQPTPGESVPEEAVSAAKALATRLGIVEDDVGPFAVGYLFDLLNHVIEALSGTSGATGHAQAGVSEVEPPAAPETEVVAPQTDPTSSPASASPTAEGETAVGGTEAPAAPPASLESAAGPAIDEIVAKAAAQWGGGSAPAA